MGAQRAGRISYSEWERSGPTSAVSRIRTRKLDGTGEETLLETDLGQMNVEDWSADGETILFTRGRDVFLLLLRDRSVVRLTADGAYNVTPPLLRSPRR